MDDPINLNRIQINIFGLTDDIPTESLPWCEMQFCGEMVTYPKVDDIVWLFFEGGDIFRPIYLGTIYAGLDITTDLGYEKFASNMDLITESETAETTGELKSSVAFKPIVDIDSYRSTLRVINQTDTDKHLIMKDTISHYDVLTKETTWSRSFGGFQEAVLTPPSGWVRGVVDPKYGNCPYPPGQAMYPWYELREKDSTSWKSIYGGWTFLTETDLKNGLAFFPDNVQHTYSKRYKNWVSWTVSQCLSNPGIYNSDAGMFSTAAPKSWTFLPMSPTIYSDPELFSVSYVIDKFGTHTEEMGGYCSIKPSPFATMKIKDRKHYKQSTWLSFDGKSAIELDDNENYERLRLDFNYGEGGLEFSRAGWHGLYMWTEGPFKIQSWGRVSAGTGQAAFNPCTINAIDTDLHIDSTRTLLLGGSSMANMTSLGPVNIRSKMNVTSITGGKGVTIQTTTGQSLGEGTTEANEGTWFGSPIIAGNGEAGDAGSAMNGWMATLLSADLKTATEYFTALNSAILMLRKLAFALKSCTFPIFEPAAAYMACSRLVAWGIAADPLLSQLDAGGILTPVSVMVANETINIEGAVKG